MQIFSPKPVEFVFNVCFTLFYAWVPNTILYIYNFISPSKTVARKETKKKGKNIYNTVRISQHLADIRRHR